MFTAVFLFVQFATFDLVSASTYAPIDVSIDVSSKVTGNTPTTSETFSFEIVPEQEDYPIADPSTFKIVGTGTTTVSFVFDTVGVYEYSIFQTDMDNSRYNYDETVYELSVYVKSENGELEAVLLAYKNDGDNKSADITFSNYYKRSVSKSDTDLDTTDPDTDPDPTDSDTDPDPTDPDSTNPTTDDPINPTIDLDPTIPATPLDPTVELEQATTSGVEPVVDPDSPQAQTVSDIIKTGDESNLFIFVLMMFGSLFLMIRVYKKR